MPPTSYQQSPPPPPPPSSYHYEQEDTIDIKKYFYMILANWYWFVVSVFIGLGVAWLVNRYTKPVYQVKASLMIQEDDRGRGLSSYENLIPGMEIFRNQKKVLNELEVLKSYSLTNRALKELDFGVTYVGVGRSGFKENYLYQNAPFYVVLDTGKNNIQGEKIAIDFIDHEIYEIRVNNSYDIKEKGRYGQPFNSDQLNFTLFIKDTANFTPDIGYNSYYIVFRDLNGLTNLYRSKVNIDMNDDKRGSVLFLSSSGFNAEQEAKYINKLMEVYILSGLEEKNQTAINTVDFIDQQLGIINDSLQSAEVDLQNFRLKNSLVSVSTEGDMAYQRLEKYYESKAHLELEANYYQYLLEYVKNKNRLNEIVAPSTLNISDQLLNGLIKQLNDLLVEKEELLFSVQPGNPRITLLDNKIESARQALIENVQGLIKNNAANLREVNRQLAEADRSLLKLPVTERQLISIQRQYKVNDQIYTYLLQKRAEAAIAKAANVADNKVLDIARYQNAALTTPKTKMNYMIGLLLGIFLPLGLLVFLDLINNKITGRGDIEGKTSVPVVSVIGHNAGTGDIPVFENPKSALSESFRGLRTNMQYLLSGKDQKIVTVTSTISGEGKTFCSVNLAAIFAMAGKKTLLMGLDMRKPKIHKIFNINNDKGVSTCLIGKDEFESIVRDTQVANLKVMPSGPIPPNPSELIDSEAMREIIEKAREQFDIVILDTPPIGMVTDALLLSRISDLSLFILRQNYSSKNILELFEDIYIKSEVGKMGIILNDMKQRGYYGYGYRYYNAGYTYKYGYYSTYNEYTEGKEED